MPLQCATVGFGSLEESTAGFAESRVLVCVGCQLCVNSPPPPHWEWPFLPWVWAAGNFPIGVSSGEHPALSAGGAYQGPLGNLQSLGGTNKALQGKEQWGFTPELGVSSCVSCEPPNPVAPSRREHAVALFANSLQCQAWCQRAAFLITEVNQGKCSTLRVLCVIPEGKT